MKKENRYEDGTYTVKKNRKVNILAFIGCLLLSIIIWNYVVNTKISDNTKIFFVKMEIKGESVLLNDNNYTLFGAPESSVKITVQGTKAELNKYSEDDFEVYIDVSKIMSAGMTPANIIVETPSSALSVISIDPVQTTVFIDEKIYNQSVKLNVDVNEEKIGDDVVVEINTDTMRLSGPKTYVDQISYAKLTVDSVRYDFVDKNGNYMTEYTVSFYDATDTLIQSPYLVSDLADISVTVKGTGAETTDAESVSTAS